MGIQITETMLKEIHEELPDELRKLKGKPLFITVSYKDETTDKLEHWMGQNNGLAYADMALTLAHLTGQIEKDLKPKEDVIVKSLRRQLRAKTNRAARKIRTR